MNPLSGAAQELALATANLLSSDDPEGSQTRPASSRSKPSAIQSINFSARLNRIQTEADSWADLRQAS